MKSLQLKVPPLLLTIIVAWLIWVTHLLLPKTDWNLAIRLLIACVLVTIANIIIGFATWKFKDNKTTVNPLNPNETTSLVRHGIYQYTRNPMYLGFALFLTAWIVYLGQFLLLFWLAFFIIYMTQLQIKPEEQFLQNKFTDEYIEYKQSVRRWI